MTDEIRNNLIEKMIDRPADLSPDEIAAIMGDAELRDFYEISVDLQNSLIEEPQINAEEEWGNFRRLLSARRRHLSLKAIMQIAAIFIGIALLSGVVLNIINNQSSQTSVTGMLADVQRTNDSCGIAVVPKTKIAINEQQPTTTSPTSTSPSTAETPHSTPSSPKTAPTIASETKATTTPTATANATTDIYPSDFDPDQYVKVQQARIDNEIAMAMAKRYLTEYNIKRETEAAMLLIDGSSPDNNTDLSEINRITML